MHVLGLDAEATDFARFIADVCFAHGNQLQIMYGIGGERELTESTLDHLSGYGGAQPVRIGNGAFDQRQNDVYGALVDSLYIHSKASREIPAQLWPIVAGQVEAAAKVWREPDQGIWEARGAPKHYVSSKLMCWVALDRGARLARRRGDDETADRWRATADEIQADILARGVSERGRAAPALRHRRPRRLEPARAAGPLPAARPRGDPQHGARDRRRAHRPRPRAALPRRGDRRRPPRRGGDVHDLLVLARLGALGDRRAPSRPARCARGCSRSPGRSASTRRRSSPAAHAHLGNFPQAFTHLALINAVAHVIADEQREDDEPRAGPRCSPSCAASTERSTRPSGVLGSRGAKGRETGTGTLLLALVVPGSASAAVGDLTQLSGTAGCISGDGSGGDCATDAVIESPYGIATSADGRSVYCEKQKGIP